MSVETQLKRTGNGRAFTVPAAFFKAHHLEQYTLYKMDFLDGRIVIEPVADADVADEEALIAGLLEGFDSGNVHSDLLRSDRRGQEEF